MCTIIVLSSNSLRRETFIGIVCSSLFFLLKDNKKHSPARLRPLSSGSSSGLPRSSQVRRDTCSSSWTRPQWSASGLCLSQDQWDFLMPFWCQTERSVVYTCRRDFEDIKQITLNAVRSWSHHRVTLRDEIIKGLIQNLVSYSLRAPELKLHHSRNGNSQKYDIHIQIIKLNTLIMMKLVTLPTS